MKKNRRLLMLFTLMFFLFQSSMFSQLVCKENVVGSLTAGINGPASLKIYAESMVENYEDAEDLQISLDNVVFAEFLTFTCDDIGGVIVYAKGTVDGVVENCFTTLTIEDKLYPIVIAQNITVSLNGGNSVTITPDDIDAGSYDNCSIESMTLSQSTFTSNGTYNVELTVFDPSNNSSTAFAAVTVVGGQPVCNDFLNISLDVTGQAVVPASIFLQGSGSYDVLEVSLDNVNFGETVTFTCEDIDVEQTVYVHVEIDGNEFNCTSTAFIEDKLAPVPVVEIEFTINLASETDTYTLLVGDINDGSWDNCTDLTYSLSQIEFSIADWGENLVFLTVTDGSGNTNFAATTVIVLVDGEPNPLDCVSLSTAVAEVWGSDIELWGVDFVINNNDFDVVLASLDPSGPYTESFIVDCGESVNGPLTVYIQAMMGTNQFNCSVELTVVDVTAPVVVAKQNITLVLNNGVATLTAEEVDNGSYDNCTDVTLSIDKTMFTTAHIGENQVWLTVEDENGNYNMTWTNVIVLGDDNECTVYHVIFPDYIEVFDENGTVENLSIENLQTLYGYTYEEVHAYTVEECEAIAYTYADVEINSGNVIKVVRTWTVLDWLSAETKTHSQLLKLYTEYNTALACNDNISVTVQNGSVTIYPQDVLEGGPYNFDNMTLSMEDANGDIVEDNLITVDYVGQTLTYTVSDNTTGNTCWGTLTVEEGFEGCALDDEDVSYPLATIQLTEFNLDPQQLSPEILMSDYGYELSEVLITWVSNSCQLVGYTYEDDVFDYGDGSFKILRTITVVDWITYDPNGQNEGIWTFTQVINAGVNPNNLICDILPRTADVGDCDSGHTLDDDVEWPADLAISDYRITPAELIEFSMVDVLDSEPSFYNNPDNYSSSYIDLLIELTNTSLEIGRLWTASHNVYGFTWTYTQTIIVDITEFENLVNVNTGTNRAMPGVIINETFMTNNQGDAIVEGEPVSSLSYEDEYLNGINILDLILIQKHILDVELLPEFGVIAADVNGDGSVKVSDITELRKKLLSIIPTDKGDWVFYDKVIVNPISIMPKGLYVGVKKGDVDDTALLDEVEPIEPEFNFEALDILLNQGESYSIPVYLNDIVDASGVDFRAIIDNDLIEIVNIQSDYADIESNYHVDEEGQVALIFSSPSDIYELGGGSNPVFTIEIEAKQNSLLSLALDLETRKSYLASPELELILVGGEVGNMIGTSTNSEELSGLSIYPNPTTDYLKFDMNNVTVKGDFEVSIYQLNGQKILTSIDAQIIDVSDLNGGMYIYQVKVDKYTTTGKFIVTR